MNGVSTGPHDWATIAGVVGREGAKKVLVWHPSLPSWTPAARLPVFRRRRQRLMMAAVAGALVVVVGLGLGLGLGLRHGGGPAVAETPMVADFTEDVPGEIWDTVATPDEEAMVSGGGATIVLPRGAVSESASVTLTRFSGVFDGYGFAQAPVSARVELGEGEAAYAVSPVFDVGPAGTRFEKPVTVAVEYDERALRPGASERDIVLVYFDGAEWAPLPTLIDRDANTASVALESFDGTVISAVVVIGAVAVGIVVNRAITWWYGPEAVKSDPISDKLAHTYITPQDPVVSDWAQRAVLCTRKDVTTFSIDRDPKSAVKLTDPQAVGTMTQSGSKMSFGYRDGSGQVRWLADNYNQTDTWAGWQRPADYFGTRNLAGDCTDQTNGTVSVLRNLGFPAKGVFGYFLQGGTWGAHTWAEVVIDGKPYIVSTEGDLFPATADGLQAAGYKRPDSADARRAMWDENGQQPYVQDWWTTLPTTTTSAATTTTTLGTGEIDLGQVAVPADHTLDRYATASSPSDAGDLRVYVTYSRSYASDSGPRFSISVWEYSVVDGKALESSAVFVYSWDVGSATGPGEAYSAASAAIAQRMTDVGLVANGP